MSVNIYSIIVSQKDREDYMAMLSEYKGFLTISVLHFQ